MRKKVSFVFFCEFEGGVWNFWKYPTYLFQVGEKYQIFHFAQRFEDFFSNPICCCADFPGCKQTQDDEGQRMILFRSTLPHG